MNSKQRTKKYSRALKNAPKIEPHCYYESDNNKNLKEVDSLDVRHQGITFGTTIDNFQDEMRHHEELKEYIRVCENRLTTFLLEKGYNTPNVDLNVLIDDLNKLQVISPDDILTGYEFDEQGYVIGLGYSIVTTILDKPDDFDKGYWKFDGKAWLLDEDKYKQLWGAML